MNDGQDVHDLRIQRVGGRRIYSLPETAEFDHPSSIIYFKVADIKAAHAQLSARGISFATEPHMIAKLADELESGATLSQALQAVPSVASQGTRVAAAVGETTGNLAECLRRSDHELSSAAWLERRPT